MIKKESGWGGDPHKIKRAECNVEDLLDPDTNRLTLKDSVGTTGGL